VSKRQGQIQAKVTYTFSRGRGPRGSGGEPQKRRKREDKKGEERRGKKEEQTARSSNGRRYPDALGEEVFGSWVAEQVLPTIRQTLPFSVVFQHFPYIN
jgi:hypothetical protein